MKYEAEIEIEDDNAEIYYSSLFPERPIREDRCRVEMEIKGKVLKLYFVAKDFTALRAALHSYLRWLKVVEDVMSVWRERR